MTAINLRAAEARELIDAGRVDIVRAERSPKSPSPFPSAGTVVACREPWRKGFPAGGGRKAFYRADREDKPDEPRSPWSPAASMPKWAIRLHARVESRNAGQRDCNWFWVAVLVREESR